MFALFLNSSCLSQPLKYLIEPHFGKENYVDVTMEFNTGNATETQVNYLNEYGGIKNLSSCISEITSNINCSKSKTDQFYSILFNHRPYQLIRLHYRIVSNSERKLVNENIYRPIIDSNFFNLYGFGLFFLPGDYWNDKSINPVTIKWIVPKNFILSTSFKTGFSNEYMMNLDHNFLKYMVIMGGNFGIKKFFANGNEVIFSYKRFKNINIDSAFYFFKQAITISRNFWKDNSQKYFMTSFLPTYEVWNEQEKYYKYMGVAFLNSFSCFMSDNKGARIKDLVYLFFHEYLHNWIGKKIKIKHEEQQYWFSEGFTEYFQLKLQLKARTISLKEFAEQINDRLIKLYSSPVRLASNKEITFTNFWSNPDYQNLPYLRGSLYAFYLDMFIRSRQHKKLDDVLHELFKESQTIYKDGFEDEDIIQIIARITNIDFSQSYMKYILNGEDIDWSGIKFPKGLKIITQENHPSRLSLDSSHIRYLRKCLL